MSSCSFSACDAQITENHDQCEIKTVLPKSFKKTKTKLKSSFLVNWQENGEAKFHRNCWDILLKISRKRTKKKTKSDLLMIQEEKMLIKEAAKTVEYFDSMENVNKNAKKVAELIIQSKHCVCFTGAGISTSAGIGDYRGKNGKWTQQDQENISDTVEAVFNTSTFKEPAGKRIKVDEDSDNEEDDGVKYELLRPTYTHEALQKLLEMGLLKYIISQNGDGLHTLSQVKSDQISELHGNAFVEKCEKCMKRYERPYYVMDDECSQYYEDLEEFGNTDIKKPSHAKKCSLCGLSHRTGRKCKKRGCKGHLIDTIINFKDNLEDDIYESAVDNAKKSDIMLCLGTTLLVTPANELVEMTQKPMKIVICNRQKTPLDYLYVKRKTDDIIYGSRVYGDCDIFMKDLMGYILSPEELSLWEAGRIKRLQIYDTLRSTE